MLWVLLCTWLAGAAEFEFGDRGGTIDLPVGWSRGTFSESYGRDQFAYGQLHFMVIQEVQGVFLGQRDLERHMRISTQHMKDIPNAERIEVFEYEVVGDGLGHLGERWSLNRSGLRLAFDFHVYGRGDAAILLFTWTTIDKADDLDRFALDLGDRIQLPPAPEGTAEWGVEQHEEGRYLLSMPRPPVLTRVRDERAGAADVALLPTDDTLLVYGFIDEYRSDDVDSAVQGVLDVSEDQFSADPTITRKKIKVDGRKGVVAEINGSSPGGQPRSAWLTIVPLGERRFLDLRVFSDTPPDGREDLWKRIIEETTVVVAEPLDAVPEVEQPQGGGFGDPTDAQLRLLQKADRIGRFKTGNALLTPDAYAVATDDAILWSDLDSGETRELDHTLGRGVDVQALLDDAVLVRDASADLHRVGPHGTDALGVSANAAVDLGAERLLLARNDRNDIKLGLSMSPPDEGATVVVRNGDEEREIARLSGWSVVDLGVNGQGTHALLGVRAVHTYTHALVVVDLASGALSEPVPCLGVGSIAPDADGWLVSATRADGLDGVFVVGADGQLDAPILTGGHLDAVRDDKGHLVLATRIDIEPGGTWSDAPIYRIPARKLEKFGPGYAPLSAAGLEALASQVFAEDAESDLFTDATTVRAAAARVRAAWPEALGPTPDSPEAVDLLIDALHSQESVSDSVMWLVEVLAADVLLEEGGEWVAGNDGELRAGRWFFAHHDYAMGVHLRERLRSALQDSEGYYEPVQGAVTSARGRTLVLGLDRTAIRDRVAALDRGPLPDAATADAAVVLGALQAAPDNDFIRDQVLGRLLIAERWDLIPQVARDRDGDDDDELHRVALTLARTHDLPADERVEAYRAAIVAHPSTQPLYLLLAQAYQDRGSPRDDERARATYQHIIDTFRWGTGVNAARKALEELGEAQ